jgi:phage virion morphogenesis protein
MARITARLESASVLQVLEQLIERLGDASPATREIAGVLAFEAEEAFELERSPGGTPWEQLAQSTIEQRIKLGYWPGRMLQRTGRLAASVTSDFGPDFAVVGSNVEYAGIHQFGGQAGRGLKSKIPERAFLGISEAGEDEILELMEGYLSR